MPKDIIYLTINSAGHSMFRLIIGLITVSLIGLFSLLENKL